MTRTPVPRVLALNLERAIGQSYADLALDVPVPTVRHGHGQTSAADSDECGDIWIGLTLIQPKPLEPNRCAIVPSVRFRLELWRCWPTPDDGGIADWKAEEETATLLQADAYALFHLAQLSADGELVRGIPELRCDAFRFGDLRPLGPLGGRAGWGVDLTIDLFGTPLLVNSSDGP